MEPITRNLTWENVTVFHVALVSPLVGGANKKPNNKFWHVGRVYIPLSLIMEFGSRVGGAAVQKKKVALVRWIQRWHEDPWMVASIWCHSPFGGAAFTFRHCYTLFFLWGENLLTGFNNSGDDDRGVVWTLLYLWVTKNFLLCYGRTLFFLGNNTERVKYLENKQHFYESTAVHHHHHPTTTLPRAPLFICNLEERMGFLCTRVGHPNPLRSS